MSNPQSAIRNPQSAIRNPQSAIPWSLSDPLALSGAQIVIVSFHPEDTADRALRFDRDGLERLLLLWRGQLGIFVHLFPITQRDGFIAVNLRGLFFGELESGDQRA